ncbi:glycosyltransferase family protein [Candidatus Kaiserbacteria bacterium]|nr:glycosyltransferase family protein [Candidatus Kaiserbacteria bacterium]
MINGKKVVTTIEARMTSTRLPGKILMSMIGKPVLQHIIERHQRSKFVDEVVVATTVNATDEPVVALCESIGCAYFRGSEDDVLARVVGAGAEHHADILVQGYGDDPCVDWRFVDHVVQMLVDNTSDCAVSNDTEDTFPIGLGVCAYAFPALQQCAAQDTDPAYREHAGYSIRSQHDKFNVVTWRAEEDLFRPELRLTLDTPEDFQMISAIYDALYPANPDFSADDVVTFLSAHPEIVAINNSIRQKVPQTGNW